MKVNCRIFIWINVVLGVFVLQALHSIGKAFSGLSIYSPSRSEIFWTDILVYSPLGLLAIAVIPRLKTWLAKLFFGLSVIAFFILAIFIAVEPGRDLGAIIEKAITVLFYFGLVTAPAWLASYFYVRALRDEERGRP